MSPKKIPDVSLEELEYFKNNRSLFNTSFSFQETIIEHLFWTLGLGEYLIQDVHSQAFKLVQRENACTRAGKQENRISRTN